MRWLNIIFMVSCCLTACNGQSISDQQAQSLNFNQIFVLDGKSIHVAVFNTPAQREKGLMWIKHLPKDHGALFVFEQESEVGFWMKNTLISLDIFFFDKKHHLVKTLKSMQPCLSNCQVYKVERVKYVLELATS